MLLKNSRFTEQSILYLKIAKLQICCCLRLVASFHLEMIHKQFLVYNSDLGYRIKTLKIIYVIIGNKTRFDNNSHTCQLLHVK